MRKTVCDMLYTWRLPPSLSKGPLLHLNPVSVLLMRFPSVSRAAKGRTTRKGWDGTKLGVFGCNVAGRVPLLMPRRHEVQNMPRALGVRPPPPPQQQPRASPPLHNGSQKQDPSAGLAAESTLTNQQQWLKKKKFLIAHAPKS